MEISIKKPCHENWNDMTPNEQGAFCGKCVKTVVDFTNKSLDEIKAFFADKGQQKICGRFEEQQLTALSFDAFFERFKRFEFTKRLAVILFFTFGFWLFGMPSVAAQTGGRIKGDVLIKEPTKGQVAASHDTTRQAAPRPEKVMGKVAPTKCPKLPEKKPDPQPVKPKQQKPQPPKQPRMGAVSAVPDKK